jgi:hypothetical protein
MQKPQQWAPSGFAKRPLRRTFSFGAVDGVCTVIRLRNNVVTDPIWGVRADERPPMNEFMGYLPALLRRLRCHTSGGPKDGSPRFQSWAGVGGMGNAWASSGSARGILRRAKAAPQNDSCGVALRIERPEDRRRVAHDFNRGRGFGNGKCFGHPAAPPKGFFAEFTLSEANVLRMAGGFRMHGLRVRATLLSCREPHFQGSVPCVYVYLQFVIHNFAKSLRPCQRSL